MVDTINYSHKLAPGQQKQILQWLAEDWGPAVVVKFVKEEFNIDISRQAAFSYSKRYESEIQILREKVRASEVPISQKEVRQQRREAIFRRYMNAGKLEEARQVLNDAQEEMEPKQRGVHVGVRVDNNPGTTSAGDKDLRGIISLAERFNQESSQAG